MKYPTFPLSEISGFSELKLGAGFGLALLHWASLVAQLVKNPLAMRETWVRSLSWEDPPGEEKDYPLQYSGLENSMDCIVHGVAKSRTRQSNSHFTPPLGHGVPSGCPMGTAVNWGTLGLLDPRRRGWGQSPGLQPSEGASHTPAGP